MIKLLRTNSHEPDFRDLVSLLDADLAVRDGDDHTYYAQFNKISMVDHTVVAYDGKTPIGCGALKSFSKNAMEIKRMFVQPDHRGKGVASKVLRELEEWAQEMGCEKCVLETGKMQPEALALYKKSGYRIIDNYGPYIGISNSVCFEKLLS